ncbi:MAG: alcohol dehydrogenase catalytic domain-containing protein, partial [Chloroflexota bacterium]
MKAATYHAFGDIRVDDIPEPEAPGPGEITVRIKVCGVCGSDVTAWYMDPRAPTVLGHEPAGDVAAVGAGVTDFKVGDRVALHHHVPCMVCDLCRRGSFTLCAQFKATRLYPAGMAEFVRVPAEIVRSDVLKLPDNMPYEAGALVEPIACCVRALDRTDIQNGDTVVIVGAGFNGIVMAMLAPTYGAHKVAILDLQDIRLEKARALGLTAFNSGDADIKEQVAAWAGGIGPHAVVVTPSKMPVIQFGFDLLGPGGTLMMYGPPQKGVDLALDANRVFFEEIT